MLGRVGSRKYKKLYFDLIAEIFGPCLKKILLGGTLYFGLCFFLLIFLLFLFVAFEGLFLQL